MCSVNTGPNFLLTIFVNHLRSQASSLTGNSAGSADLLFVIVCVHLRNTGEKLISSVVNLNRKWVF